MSVSKHFIIKAKKFIRLLNSKYVNEKEKLSPMAWEIYQESLEKGNNRRILYRMIKNKHVFGLFMRLVLKEKAKRME